MNVIQERIPVCELLAGLAEEAAELAQAALKLRRCYDGTNPTPADPDRQYENLIEEVGDVEIYLDMLDVFKNRETIADYKAAKVQRWIERLEG